MVSPSVRLPLSPFLNLREDHLSVVDFPFGFGRTFSRDQKQVIEKVQALKLVRRVIDLSLTSFPTTSTGTGTSSGKGTSRLRVPLSDTIVRTLVSVAENADDSFRLVVLETLAEIGTSTSLPLSNTLAKAQALTGPPFSLLQLRSSRHRRLPPPPVECPPSTPPVFLRRTFLPLPLYRARLPTHRRLSHNPSCTSSRVGHRDGPERVHGRLWVWGCSFGTIEGEFKGCQDAFEELDGGALLEHERWAGDQIVG